MLLHLDALLSSGPNTRCSHVQRISADSSRNAKCRQLSAYRQDNCRPQRAAILSNCRRLKSCKVKAAACVAEDDFGNAAIVPLKPPKTTESRKNEIIASVLNLPWQRLATWLVVAVFAAQLKDFFGIVMGTYVVSFIGNGFVQTGLSLPSFPAISPKVRRKLLVVLYFTSIVSMLTLFGVMTIPDIIREGADFVQRLKSNNVWVVVLEKMRNGLGDGVMDQVERFLLVASGDELGASVAMQTVTTLNVQQWTSDRTQYLALVLQKMLRGYTDAAVMVTSNLITFISRFAIQVGVSLILSFMVVWDLPAIARGVQSLETSRLAPIYKEVAPSLSVFGQLFGKALQAQARIAVMNTALTALGMWALQIPGIGLLSLFVFVCGFIPIAGVFISTVPIGFVALTEYGFLKLGLVGLMVTLVHFVEAYGLNPAIYSHHLKLHPLLVLSVLVVAEHSLGVWGLLLAVPLTVFALDYCIRYPACSVTDVAAKELATVSISDHRGNFTIPDEILQARAAAKKKE